MKTYQIRGYTKTGIYSVEVEAQDYREALRKGKAEIAKLEPLSKILRYNWSPNL